MPERRGHRDDKGWEPTDKGQKPLRRRRVHGLELPLHPLQVLGWLAIVGISVGTFTILIPLLEPRLRLPVTLGLSGLLLVHVAFQLVALLIDPGAQLSTGENSERCHLCNVDARARTKHCWYCNKCIVGFDHHCKWLNNCIGAKNYPVFIGCVLSAIGCTLAVTGIVLLELVLYLRMDNATTLMSEMPGTGSLVVMSIVGILSTIAAVLLIHLCLFHGYIGCLGVTTYEYVTARRRRQRQRRQQQPPEPKKSYHFCESVSMTESSNFDTNRIYICSSHAASAPAKTDYVDRDRKKFHLYFSYETRTGSKEEVQEDDSSSRADDSSATSSTIQLKPSTPSPVSCCFSIMSAASHQSARTKAGKSKRAVTGSENQKQHLGRRSCATIKRIHTFLSTRLRKSARQRALAEASTMRKNKVTPLGGAAEQPEVTGVYKLPSAADSIHAPTAAVVLKRNHMRLRKSALRKRPRFSVDNHLTQTAQLSPIPESEHSKPASPLATRFSFSAPPVQTPAMKN